jgi:DNA-binding MurR/RpiR family transcriptional regulator
MAAGLEGMRGDFDVLAEFARSAQEARVSNWLSAHLPEVAWKTVGDVASTVGTSTATVVRTVQRAGYDGFADVQARVRACLPSSELVWKLALGTPTSAGSTTLGRIVEQEKMNLDQLEATVGEEVGVLAEFLAQARHTWVTAALTSVPITQHLALHMGQLLGNVTFMEAASLMSLNTVPTLGPEDLVIAVSFPRYAQSTLDDVAHAVRVTRAVVITDRNGPVLPGTSLTLKLPVVSQVHFSSSVALVTLTMALARLVHERQPDRVENNLSRIDRSWTERGVLRRPQRGRRSRV